MVQPTGKQEDKTMILVQFEQTQNPNKVRIFPEESEVPQCHRQLASGRSSDRLVGALLAIQGIANVVIERNAITVTRSDEADAWVSLWPQIDRAIYTLAS